MTRYLAYSSGLHALLIAFLFLSAAVTKPPRAYYGFQFVGGASGYGPGRLEPAPAPAAPKIASKGTASAKKTPKETARRNDKNKIAVKKEEKTKPSLTQGKPTGKDTAPATAAVPQRGGMPGGRGVSADGRGDRMGSKFGPVGGVGSSLEIGGFGPGGGGEFSARFPYAWYVNILYQKLWKAWNVEDPGTKECTVLFTIARDGSLADAKLQEPSGDSVFDFMALRAVKVSAPFPPLPEGYSDPSLDVVVRFRFQ
ncbi:MAG TPA: TonB family protein [Elusimicrobiota bacterium]|nr:TonB family protein [Elusimicrobiota bacterium]